MRFSLCCIAVICGFSSAAGANGRFPQAQQLSVDPEQPDQLWLRASYGLMTSADHGQRWSWVCEAALGYPMLDVDLFVTLAAEQRVLVGLAGLSVSGDLGCGWSPPSGDFAHKQIADLSTSTANPRSVFALSWLSQGSGSFLNELWHSTDAARSFSKLGASLPANALFLTFDVAPSNPNRLYASAVFADPADGGSVSQGALLVSDDAGQNWQRRDVPGSSFQSSPFIGAVDPGDADRVYVRIAGSQIDQLLLSRDAGLSFQPLLSEQARLLGFAISPDGSQVVAGFGDALDGRAVERSKLGVWRANTSDHAFSQRFKGNVKCLTWAARGLYACGAEFSSGFELGFSNDAGDSFEPLLTRSRIQGPLQCPTGTQGAACASSWPATCDLLELCDAGVPAPDAGLGPGASDASGSGCGCRGAGTTRVPAWPALLAALLIASIRVRTRAPRARPGQRKSALNSA